MKLGMNLLLWTTEVTEEHYPALQQLKECGFDGVEVPVGPGVEEDYVKLAGILDDMGLERTAVFAVDEEADPISPDAAVRDAAVEALRVAVAKTRALGASHVVGPFHSAYKKFSGFGPTEDERASSQQPSSSYPHSHAWRYSSPLSSATARSPSPSCCSSRSPAA